MSKGKYLRNNSPTPQSGTKFSALWSAAYWIFLLVYLELAVHLVFFGFPGVDFAYTIGFSAVFALAITALTSFIPRKANFTVTLILTLVMIVLYGSQMVYYFIFGSLYSVAQMKMGGEALASFWRETLLAMGDHILPLLALLLPVAVLIALHMLRRNAFAPCGWISRGGLVAAAVAIQIITVSCLSIGGSGFFSHEYFYSSASTTTDQATDRFGLLTAFRLNIFGSGEDAQERPGYYIPETTTAPTEAERPTQPPQAQGQEQETTAPTEPEPDPVYNILNIDFSKLNEMTDDETRQAINAYCSSLSGTKQNEYTGMLSDYNLILLCAEGFSTAALHPEVTPTLYSMANQGFVFNNFYNAFPNNTIDGEYALCMGLLPDTSRDKNSNSFLASRMTYLPFCLGNIFQDQKGVESYGYHNYISDYYSRCTSHPKMGYQMQFAWEGINLTDSWPTSDLEMMQDTVDDYLSQDQFHAYYMTFSGHLRYDKNINAMAQKNYHVVADMDLSEEAKCYLACHVELDNALSYLMERLEAEGVADKTAIVLVGDHFPYGLTDETYSELVGYTIDEFSKYHSTMIFWVGGMEESIQVDEYCCNVDVLPTILNLWGFDYDSRLLSGTDIFSDSEHMAIRIDKSFYTDKVWVNASTGEIHYLVDESELPTNYVENHIRMIDTKFSVAADILNSTYFKYVFQDCAEAVTPKQPQS